MCMWDISIFNFDSKIHILNLVKGSVMEQVFSSACLGCVQINLVPISPSINVPYTNLAIQCSPLKTNMSPENQWLEDAFPTEIVRF